MPAFLLGVLRGAGIRDRLWGLGWGTGAGVRAAEEATPVLVPECWTRVQELAGTRTCGGRRRGCPWGQWLPRAGSGPEALQSPRQRPLCCRPGPWTGGSPGLWVRPPCWERRSHPALARPTGSCGSTSGPRADFALRWERPCPRLGPGSGVQGPGREDEGKKSQAWASGGGEGEEGRLGASGGRAAWQTPAASGSLPAWVHFARTPDSDVCQKPRSGPAQLDADEVTGTRRPLSMSQRHSDSSLEEKLLEYRFHSELRLDAKGNPAPGLPMVRDSLQVRDNAAFQVDTSVPPPLSTKDEEPRTIVLSTQSPAALKMGTQQLIPRSLAVSSKAKTPARHQSFAAAVLSKEAARRDPRLVSAPSFSLDDMDLDTGPEGALRRNLRNRSYRAAMQGLGAPGGERTPIQLSPKLQALAEEPSPPPVRCPAKNKRTLGRKRAHKGSFKDDPGFYQEIRERGLNTSHESDDDLLDEPSGPDGTGKADAPIVVKSYRPAQVTWSQLPEVVESGLLDELSAEERKRQEAIFEILTSEFSYQHSLGILVAEFLQSRELRATMTQTEHHHLFSNILDVLSASQRFFEALEQRHKAQVCVEDISDILEEHAERHFHPYVAYCSNEVYQQRALQKLTTSNAAFHEALKEIEKRPACGGLPMISFLILPMQRVTRLPLLTDTLCLKSQGHPERYKAASRALKAISKLVKRCNEGAHKMERTEQMYTLHTQLDFGRVKSLPLISASRWLLKRGELFVVEETGLFRKLASRPTCYLFLFNDVLVVTKKKSEDSFMVQDYAQVDHIRVQKMEPSDPSLLGGGGNRCSSVPHPFRVTLLHNSEGRQEKILLSSDSASDRARWITALTHRERQGQGPTDKGDLPQVEITKAYLAKQADEITLQQADVVLVLEQEDGWVYGERLRDGETGWFPEDFARYITSRVAVEGNVRRMERLRVETDV